MQPYFFPYLGYFSLIKHTDKFILLDTVKFIRHGWIDRNRILKHDNGWMYIKVPLQKHSSNTLIKDIKIDSSKDWREKIISQLQLYRKKAPFFKEIMQLVEKSIEAPYEDIISLNKSTLEEVCNYLGMHKSLPVFSDLDLEIDEPRQPDDWALNICKAIGVNDYLNLPGGINFFDTKKYKDAGININFLNISLSEYDQKNSPFEPGLSIIDVLMFNDVQDINDMLDNYSLA